MYPCVPGKAGEAHLGHLDLTGYRYGFRQVRGPRRAMGRSQYGFYKTTSLPNAQEGGPPFSNFVTERRGHRTGVFTRTDHEQRFLGPFSCCIASRASVGAALRIKLFLKTRALERLSRALGHGESGGVGNAAKAHRRSYAVWIFIDFINR